MGNVQTDEALQYHLSNLDARVAEAGAGRKVMPKTAAATPKEHSTAGPVGDRLHRDEAVRDHTGWRQHWHMAHRKDSVLRVRCTATVVGQPWDRGRHIDHLNQLLKMLVEPAGWAADTVVEGSGRVDFQLYYHRRPTETHKARDGARSGAWPTQLSYLRCESCWVVSEAAKG